MSLIVVVCIRSKCCVNLISHLSTSLDLISVRTHPVQIPQPRTCTEESKFTCLSSDLCAPFSDVTDHWQQKVPVLSGHRGYRPSFLLQRGQIGEKFSRSGVTEMPHAWSSVTRFAPLEWQWIWGPSPVSIYNPPLMGRCNSFRISVPSDEVGITERWPKLV